MKVNNFDRLALYFNHLQNKDDFYYIQIIQRKKDGNVKSEKIIKNLYVYNLEYLLKRQDYIKDLCQRYNARAYFWINPRNAKNIALECIKSYVDLVSQQNCSKGYKIWDKKCREHIAPTYEHKWIVDIDSIDSDYITKVINIVNECRGNNPVKMLDVIPTINGVHLITRKFDTHQFRQACIINNLGHIDVHKNNPTLLYYEKDERTDM